MKRKPFFEHFFRFAREANDDIRRNGNARHRFMQPFDFRGKFRSRIFAAHPLQYGVFAGLKRNMQMTAHFAGAVQHVDHRIVDLARFDGADANALKTFDLVQIPQQARQIVIFHIIAVAAGMNARQHDFLVAGSNQLLRLLQDALRRRGCATVRATKE